MSIRRQCYEWRNVGKTQTLSIGSVGVTNNNYDDVILNSYPVSAINYDLGGGFRKAILACRSYSTKSSRGYF